MNRLGTKRRQSSAKKINNNATTSMANGAANQNTADDRRNKTNQLFEELLGDDASAIANEKDKTKGGEESVMSSVLRPQQATRKVPQSQHDNNDDPQDRGVSLSGPAQKRNQMQQHFNQEQFEHDDEDTLMTKPREIMFDSNSDDVSALFGGIGGGASVIAERMQSYRGNVAKNRRAFSAGNRGAGSNNKRRATKFFNSDGNNNKHDEESRRTGASTLKSHGVTSILEEIGLRPSSKGIDKASTSDSDEENKGHVRHRHSSDEGGGRHRNRGRRDKSSFNFNSTKTAVFCVVAMFVFVQFTTIRRQNKKTMSHLNQRFDNRYAPVREQSVSSHSGMSDGLRDLVMDNVEGGSDRRRGAYMRPNDGAARESHQRDQNWDQLDQDQMMIDDGMGDMVNAGLRGHNNGQAQAEVQRSQTGSQQVYPDNEWAQQQNQLVMHVQNQQEQAVPSQQQQQQQQQPLQHPQVVVPAQFGSDASNTNTDDMNTSDVHPLLKPNEGLSMADAVEKLGAVDKLSDIDHRPKQQLSNELIPARFKVFADLRTPFVIGRDTPFYWHIPRSGGVVMKTLLSHCLGQTLAAEVGELNGHENDEEVKIVSFAEHNYTNVNVATPEGISRALNLGLVPSHLSDTIVSSHVDLIPSLFNSNDKAKAFVMMRHPCDRATSMFYFLKGTGYSPVQNMTLDDYAKSELIENNWMVRILSESMSGPIDMDNLDIAKEVLKRKFLVGLLDNKRGSFARFDHYFKWKESPKYASEFGCRKQLMDEKYVPKHPVRKGSETWNLLMEQNRFDIHLYDYAKELFVQQSFIFGL
ncbi:hypothetical protein ACHAWT_002731 [Skeletonema menzelii]